MVGVLAEANVGDDEQIGRGVFGGFDGLLHDAAFAVRVAAERVLFSRDAEENDAAEPELCRLAGFLSDYISRKLSVARHRADRLPPAFSGPREEGEDQLRRIEACLTDEAADGGVIAEPPEARRGKTRFSHTSVIIQRNRGANVFPIRETLAVSKPGPRNWAIPDRFSGWPAGNPRRRRSKASGAISPGQCGVCSGRAG